MSFKKDLKDGEAAEIEFEKLLKSRGYSVGRNTSQTITEKRFYDLWAQTTLKEGVARKVKKRPVETFEIKFDRRVGETGNVYFEHETLEYSRADYIVYKLDSDGKFYIQTRATVLKLIQLPNFKQVSGGDAWGLGTLIPVEQFKQLFNEAEKAIKEIPL